MREKAKSKRACLSMDQVFFFFVGFCELVSLPFLEWQDGRVYFYPHGLSPALLVAVLADAILFFGMVYIGASMFWNRFRASFSVNRWLVALAPALVLLVVFHRLPAITRKIHSPMTAKEIVVREVHDRSLHQAYSDYFSGKEMDEKLRNDNSTEPSKQ
ncbi:MAG: hypothetical protein H7222_12440 [Methylotenera sp.]|nr:hypothetical protein [Oligoflexia bacterium]